MAVAIINPNSTASMTEAMVQCARAHVPGLDFVGRTSVRGPASIQGEADGAAATPHLLDEVRNAGGAGAQGIIVGCFDDTALEEAAGLVECPVIGIGQAAYHYAALRQWRFSVVTTLAVSVPILENNVRAYGLGRHLARVRASEVPVLELEADADKAGRQILEEALLAQVEDKADAIILGCAGMVQVVERVRGEVAVPVIDPVECAATCMSWLLAKGA